MTDTLETDVARVPPRRKRSRRRLALWTIALVAVPLAVWLLWPRGGELLSVATPLPGAFGSQYHWRSDTELVVLEPEAYTNGVCRGRAEVIDVPTGARRVAARFRMRGSPWTAWDFGSVSPDGRWAVWYGSTSNGGRWRCGVGAISLVGKPHVTWPEYGWVVGTAWSRDSRSLLAGTLTLDQNAKAALQSLPVEGRPSPPIPFTTQTGVYQAGFDLSPHHAGVFGVLPSGRALLRAGGTDFREVDIRTGAVTDVDLSRAVPTFETVEQCEPSPTLDRLAWVTAHDKVPFSGWLEATGNRLGVPWRRTTVRTVWVTDIDGRHRRCIGTCADERPGVGGSSIVTLRWLPSGKRLSFVHGTTLYTVPAD